MNDLASLFRQKWLENYDFHYTSDILINFCLASFDAVNILLEKDVRYNNCLADSPNLC